MSKPFDSIPLNWITEMHPGMDFDGYHNDEEGQGESKYMKHVPIKAVKKEIMKEIKNCDPSMILSKTVSMNDW